VSDATGTAILNTFTLKDGTLYVTFSCLGPGKFALGTLFDLSPCDGAGPTVALQVKKRVRQKLTVKVSPSTEWRLLIQDGMR
jgi:hypothetical protein